MIFRDAALLADGISTRLLQGVLQEHRQRVQGLTRLRDYYDGKHEILGRVKTTATANNRLVTNHAKYIVDLASAYLIGKPVGYSNTGMEKAMEALTDAYRRCNVDSVDAELARHAGIYGRGIELLYMDGEGRPRTAAMDPRHAFVVYDNSVAHTPMFGVQQVQLTDELGQPKGYALNVYTDGLILRYTMGQGSESPVRTPEPPEQHYFGGVPMVEYWNNEDERGDFEPVLSLIDAYNLLQSDRVNDKEQLVDALLVILGATLGEDDAAFAATAKRLRDEKILELPADKADAKYLIKQLTESEVQVLADAVAADIHKIAMVPALTDEDFAGNASGVSLRYKLLGLEQLTKTKERWFREGLRSRMRLVAHILAVKGLPALDTEQVTLTFSRGLPVNDLEQAQMVSMLQDIVPEEILLGQLSFVEDAEEAMRALAAQRGQAAERRQAQFGGYADANRGREAKAPDEKE